MIRILTVILLFISVANAGELPEFLESSLQESYRIFLDYSQRAPSEISTCSLTDKDHEFFSQIEQINGFSFLFSRDEIFIYKQKIIILMSKTFSMEQVSAIIELVSSQDVERKDVKKYLKQVLEYQRTFNLNFRAIRKL